MDAYEATRVVFSRIQSLDPENAAKIMGLLLLQDHGEKEMIRLAFGPESLLESLIFKARRDLNLLPPLLASNNGNCVSSPSSWAAPPIFSRTNSGNGNNVAGFNGSSDSDEFVDELQLQDQLAFLNETQSSNLGQIHQMSINPNAEFEGWGANGHHRRSYSVSDICLGADSGGFGWKPCLYFARGYCKNGNTCRFLHGLPEDEELLLRSKSPRLGGIAGFPYSPTGSMPASPSSAGKGFNFLLQQQQSESQRAAAAAAAVLLDETNKFMGRSRIERSDFANMINPGSRQIYLTFPADSTFREEDVSNYFSIYGPVQDVRIPYQQKRMFGFVTFVYPETVKLILAKGNPHFVCDARVLVKPYKEKGKVPEKFRKQQQQGERGDFSVCTTPTGLDSRDLYDLHQLGSRMLYNNSTTEMLLRRKLEEQQQAAELQQAIELQSRRLMGLHLLDLKTRSASSPTTAAVSAAFNSPMTTAPTIAPIALDGRSNTGSHEESTPEEKSPIGGAAELKVNHFLQYKAVNMVADKEESGGEGSPNDDSDFQDSAEHNLPDSPFASPTKSSFGFAAEAEVAASGAADNHLLTSALLPSTATTLDMASPQPCFFAMPRFSSGQGAIGM
ncbi:zinc finger CCCH domain-containing protein 53-like [Typha latifolia]|uniref:zinc finger CCCH domain-containing protein 53-like n=1 Tax=Typha latifolia TaxID=4733 RepID=UPI003C30092A